MYGVGNDPFRSYQASKGRPALILRRLPNYFVLILIKLYQSFLSPVLPPSCRYSPSCSEYGHQAFAKYNFFKALYLTIWRVLRCNPFVRGGYDPLP